MSYFSDARQVIAGGVNSPVRAFAGVGGEPVFFKSASGAWLESEAGDRYIDYIGSWGPMILGHCHPAVVEAVVARVHKGMSFGAPCTLETEIAANVEREYQGSILETHLLERILSEFEASEALLARLPTALVPVEPSAEAHDRLASLARWNPDPRSEWQERLGVSAVSQSANPPRAF